MSANRGRTMRSSNFTKAFTLLRSMSMINRVLAVPSPRRVHKAVIFDTMTSPRSLVNVSQSAYSLTKPAAMRLFTSVSTNPAFSSADL